MSFYRTLLLIALFHVGVSGFHVNQNQAVNQRPFSQLCSCSEDNSFSSSDMKILNSRLAKLRMEVLETEIKRPPNVNLSAEDFVRELLKGLWDCSDPLPDAGFRLLLRSSTKDWRDKIFAAVGAPITANQEDVATALGDAIARPHNQYNILVALAEEYIPEFPTEPVDYYDGTCWIQCQLRDRHNDKLLISTGWDLKRNDEGAWLVDRIDWQDFRDEYRPGVGREEWTTVVA